MRGKASGDLDSLQTEYNSLKDARISSQKEFAKDPNNAKRMEVLEKQIHNIERSQDMARVLEQAGIVNTSVDVEDWTPERRFSVVLETATLSEMELADYYRRMGLFVEQVKEWRAISIQAHEKN